MLKLKAKRVGTLVHVPSYCNAEMLMLEFLKGDTVCITPQGKRSSSDGAEYLLVQINLHVDILDELVEFVNANI